MALALKGEVSFEFDDTSYTLVFDTEALLAVEDELDMGLFALFDYLKKAERDARSVKIGTLATLLRCSLARHHPDTTRAQAAEMLMQGGDAVQAALGVAITRMMPQGGDAGTTRPRKAVRPAKRPGSPPKMKKRNGTGPRS